MYDGVPLILSLCTTSLSPYLAFCIDVRIILSVTPALSSLRFLASIFRSDIYLGIFFTDLMQFSPVEFAFVFLADRCLTGVVSAVARNLLVFHNRCRLRTLHFPEVDNIATTSIFSKLRFKITASSIAQI